MTLMTGTTIAQAIPIGISPILTRIYTPEDFGVVGLFGSISLLLGSMANAQYESAITLPDNDEDAYEIASMSLVLALLFSMFLFIIVLFFHDSIVTLLGTEKIANWLYFIPLVVFLTGLFNVLNYLNLREKNFKELSTVKVYRSLATGFIQISMGLIKDGAFGLISGQIISNFMGNIYLLKKTIWSKYNFFSKKNIIMAKKYKKFPIYYLPNNLIFNLSNTITIVLISSLFGAISLGFYTMANRILGLPGSIIGNSISQVYLQKASEDKNREDSILPIFLETLKKLVVISLPLFILFFFTLEDIFSIIFGSEWRIAGYYAEILTPLFFIKFIRAGLNTTIIVLEKQKIGLWLNILTIVLIVCIFIVSYLLKLEITQFLYLMSYMLFLMYLYIIYIYYKLVKRKDEIA